MTMTVTIHDVGHGACTAIRGPNGSVALIDTGHNSSPIWRPSSQYQGDIVELVVLSNFDEDHLSDFEAVREGLWPQSYRWNWSVTPEAIRLMKGGDANIGPGVKAAIQVVATQRTDDVVAAPVNLGGVKITGYHLDFLTDFTDTNNLSYVTFVSYGEHKFILPGDIETQGWQKLLEREIFREELQDVNVFVASHHGRDNGYCEEVFNYCSPMIVVASDSPIAHDTQKSLDRYADKTHGINLNGKTRRVLTTRNDGVISFVVPSTGNATIQVDKNWAK